MTSSTIPTERLVIGYDPVEAEALRQLHLEAEQSYPDPPAPHLLEQISAAEQHLADSANAQIVAFGHSLRARGQRPWFEVWYPQTTVDDFDAVEVAVDGTITTMPPYAELEA